MQGDDGKLLDLCGEDGRATQGGWERSWEAVLVRGCTGLAVMCLGLGWGTHETVSGEK